MALTKISRGLLSTGVSDSSDATAITIDSSEKVGIGTTSPAKTLHISSADAQVLRVESSHAYSGIEIKGSGSSTLPPLISALGDDLLVYGGDSGNRVNVAKFADDGSLLFNSGFGSAAKAYGVRAWARFDGSNSSGSFTEGTNAGNMSSFTRTADGNFSLTMTTAMPDTNYIVAGLAGISGLLRGDNAGIASSTTVVKIETTNGNGSLFYNTTEIGVAVIR